MQTIDLPRIETSKPAYWLVIRSVLLCVGLCWLALLLARAGMSGLFAQRIHDAQAWRFVLMWGFRFDGVILGLLWFAPVALLPWFAWGQRSWAIGTRVFSAYGAAVFTFIVFMEISTPSFIHQYDSRPNFLFVEYLKHWQEVGTILIKEYPLQLILGAIAVPICVKGFLRLTASVRTAMPVKRLPVWAMVVLSLLLFAIFAVAGRGATGRRPANPAMVAVTKDHLVNEIPLSSVYTLLYAIREARSNQDGGAAYGVMEEAKALQIVKREMGVPVENFADPALPTMRKQTASIQRTKPLNFVIVLEESLGAEFVGSLGGLDLTPNLDALSKEGIWFDNLYATGTRSVRGIEAVVAGFPPTSVEATVKQSKSQRGFFTLASALKAQGYGTTFFYGGESHFDNMRSYFMGNGFERVIEKRDMADAKFVGTWGASDGDLFDRAHREFSQASTGKPFMALVFTSSNHSPFEFPDGQIQLYEQPKATVNNAVKYSDHVLGRFIASAKASPYWENTVFLIVADHNSRVYGNSIFPVSRFHIPALLIGGPVKPQRISTLASQLDLGPTALSLLGINSTHPMTGRDLLDPKQRERGGRSIMQFDQIQAYREGEHMVLLQPNGAPRAARLVNQEWTQTPDIPPDLLEKALAHAWYAKLSYSKRWHVDPPSR